MVVLRPGVIGRVQVSSEKLKEFGGNLRRTRVAANLTQEALAERVDWHHRTIQKIERGNINILATTPACRKPGG